MASSFGYASASGHGCRGPGTNIARGTINGGRPPRRGAPARSLSWGEPTIGAVQISRSCRQMTSLGRS